MKSFHFTTSMYLSIAIGLLIALLAVLSSWAFPLLSLDRTQVAQGEVWRILTSNFVHFGWAHTLMNLAAFILCALALLSSFSAIRFISLILFCCVTVGTGIYFLNPEYQIYAGLSGTIHGLIIAGLLLNKRHAYWVNGIFIVFTFAKIIYEHQTGYHQTQLQELLPVAVAYDAHLYGAIAGLLFGTICLISDKINSKNITNN